MDAINMNAPEHMNTIQAILNKKQFLRKLYREIYLEFSERVKGCPEKGQMLEIGSGGGFLKEIIPSVITSDVIAYSNVDQVIDAKKMPFEDNSLRAIFALNTFHHIDNAEVFLREVERVLVPGGKLFIFDPHPGIFSTPINKYLHHEGFDTSVKEWTFASSGPLSDANGALAWLVFKRDRKRFEKMFPNLNVVRYEPKTPLRWWISGSHKKVSLAPAFLFSFFSLVDKILLALSPHFASFVFIEIQKGR